MIQINFSQNIQWEGQKSDWQRILSIFSSINSKVECVNFVQKLGIKKLESKQKYSKNGCIVFYPYDKWNHEMVNFTEWKKK